MALTVCCYRQDGSKHYGVVEKFCYTPSIALIKPFKVTGSSLLKVSGNPVQGYAQADLLSVFFIQVQKKTLPLCAVSISHLLSKCVLVDPKNLNHSYVTVIPNNFEHH